MKKNIVIGSLCVISAFIFMVYSFLQPKTQRIIKPSPMEQVQDFGYYMHRQLRPRVSEDAAFIFFITSFNQKEIDIIKGFLSYGRERENRSYVFYSDLDLKDHFKEEILPKSAFENRLSATLLKEPESLLNTSNSSHVYITGIDKFWQNSLDKELVSKNNVHQFLSFDLNENIKNTDCPKWEENFLLEKRLHLDCFAKKNLAAFLKRREKLSNNDPLYAFEQLQSGVYVYYKFGP